jgi:hypothetical protein
MVFTSMALVMSLTKMRDMSNNLDKANQKMKELKEALQVVQKIEDQVSWACDCTSFTCISEALEPLYEVVDTARQRLENELDYLDNEISDYEFKLAEFELENKIIC